MDKKIFREDEIKQFIIDGYSWDDICKELNCKTHHVNRTAKKYSLCSKNRVIVSKQQEDEIILAYINKIPVNIISENYNIHRTTIQKILKKRNIPLQNHNVVFSKEDENVLLKYYSSRGSLYCSKILGYSRRQISRKASSMGLKKIKKESEKSIKNRLRLKIYGIIKHNEMSKDTELLLGCDKHFFKDYIESLFITGMTWDNYGKIWHIDHIVPMTYFNIFGEDHQKLCSNYKNLRPLWATTEIARTHKDFSSIGNMNKSDSLLTIVDF